MRLIFFTLVLPLAACARDDTAYPSLSPRAVERLGLDEPASPAPGPVAADASLDLEVAAASARLDKAAGEFARALARAQAAARPARGAPAGSEPWITAQTALAELDALRAGTSEIVADLERLAIDRAAALAPDYPALERERTRAKAELDGEAAEIQRIGAGLAPA